MVLSPLGARPAPVAASGPEEVAQAGPAQFLPWPPQVPSTAPAGIPPLAPSADSFDSQALVTTLEEVLAAVQTEMDKLWRWLDALRQAAAAAQAQIVLPLPVEVPAGSAAVDVVAQIAALPEQWRAIIADALAKLRAPARTDGTAMRHEADIAGSPEFAHEAGSITSADQHVVSNVMQQEVAIAATATIAKAAAEDAALPGAAAAAGTTADQMIAGAQNLPSSRAGIELLVAGTGAGLRSQALLTVALASRMSGLMQQAAQLSSQMGALASTLGIATERDLQRDRNALDAKLGLADAVRDTGTLLQRLFEGAGEPADEIRLAPLY
jgi:hypothetical protein